MFTPFGKQNRDDVTGFGSIDLRRVKNGSIVLPKVCHEEKGKFKALEVNYADPDLG